MRRHALIALVLVAPVAGCENLDLERMIDQERADVYEESPFFENGMVMQLPPDGTVSRSRELAYGPEATGLTDGQYVQQIPIPITRPLVERGRNRFDIFCAACHGLVGNGASKVAENMALRPPPSLIDPPIRDYPAGRIYTTITYGFGLMPSYAARLSRYERWAVVAYVEALQLGQRARIGELPPRLRQAAEEALP